MPGIKKKFCYFPQPPGRFTFTTTFRIIQIGSDTEVDIPAVEQITLEIILEQAVFQFSGQRTLAGTRVAGNEYQCRPVSVAVSSFLRFNFTFNPIEITGADFVSEFVGLGRRGVGGDDTASADIVSINQHESPGGGDGPEQIKGYRIPGFQSQFGNVILGDIILTGQGLQGGGIDGFFKFKHFAFHLLRV